jgi:pimeloyl-ACP methyl ester carboxylesterase
MSQKSILLSLFFSSLFTPLQGHAGLTIHDRVQWHRTIQNPAETRLSETVQAITANRHFLLVPGFGKELVDFWANHVPFQVKDSFLFWSGYFVTLEEVIREVYGASAEKVPLHVSNSWRAVEQSTEGLKKYIEISFERHGKPLVLVGHSKGGAEILYTLFKYPELMEKKVDRVLLIQAAIGGSPLIEENPEKVSFKTWFVKNVAHTLGLQETLHSLKPTVAQRNVQEHYRLFQETVSPELQAQISNRVFYLRSSMPKGRESWASYIARIVSSVNLHHVQRNESESDEDASEGSSSLGHDGFIRLEDQILENFGVDLGVFEEDHSFLAIDGWLSTTSKQDKIPIARALIEHILDPEPGEKTETCESECKF